MIHHNSTKPPIWTEKLLKYLTPLALGFIFLIPLFMFRNATTQLENYNLLKHKGVAATGTITAKTTSGPRTPYYLLRYSFKAQDGLTRFGHERTVEKIHWDAVSAGDQVPVIYLPDGPNSSHLANSTSGTEAEVMLKFSKALMVIFPVIGVILFLRKLTKPRRVKQSIVL